MKYKILTDKYLSPIIIEEYKLMWFLNAKVASSSIVRLLCRMLNIKVASNSIDYRSMLPRLSDYSTKTSIDMLTKSDWKRVIILREPKERMLSAYIGKEQKYHNSTRKKKVSHFKKLCCDHESIRIKDCWTHDFSFSEFIAVSEKCKNKHWDQQVEIVDDWRLINYVMNLKNIANGTEILLRQLGDDAWETFGAIGWGDNGASAVFRENTLHHTDSKSNLENYYTPELEKIVEERFAYDYDLLRIYFPEDPDYQ